MTDKTIENALKEAQKRQGTNITHMMAPEIFFDFCKSHQLLPTYTSTSQCLCSLLDKKHKVWDDSRGDLSRPCKNPVPFPPGNYWDHYMFFRRPKKQKIDCIVLQPYWQPNHAEIMPDVISWAESKGIRCVWNEGPGVSWWNNGAEGKTAPHLGQCVRIEFWREAL